MKIKLNHKTIKSNKSSPQVEETIHYAQMHKLGGPSFHIDNLRSICKTLSDSINQKLNSIGPYNSR